MVPYCQHSAWHYLCFLSLFFLLSFLLTWVVNFVLMVCVYYIFDSSLYKVLDNSLHPTCMLFEIVFFIIISRGEWAAEVFKLIVVAIGAKYWLQVELWMLRLWTFSFIAWIWFTTTWWRWINVIFTFFGYVLLYDFRLWCVTASTLSSYLIRNLVQGLNVGILWLYIYFEHTIIAQFFSLKICLCFFRCVYR